MNVYMTDKFAGTLVGREHVPPAAAPERQLQVDDSTWRSWRRRPRIKFADADAVTRGLTCRRSRRVLEDRGAVEYRGKRAQGSRSRAPRSATRDHDPQDRAGRPFTAQEAKAGATVVVLGHDLAEKLFANLSPLGAACAFTGSPTR